MPSKRKSPGYCPNIFSFKTNVTRNDPTAGFSIVYSKKVIWLCKIRYNYFPPFLKTWKCVGKGCKGCPLEDLTEFD